MLQPNAGKSERINPVLYISIKSQSRMFWSQRHNPSHALYRTGTTVGFPAANIRPSLETSLLKSCACFLFLNRKLHLYIPSSLKCSPKVRYFSGPTKTCIHPGSGHEVIYLWPQTVNRAEGKVNSGSGWVAERWCLLPPGWGS